ncbi:MAG: ComEA family DNA-binding protein [Blastocatellia bacterium]
MKFIRVAILSLCLSGIPVSGQERLSINQATAEQLQRLPGIGVVLARRMVEHREKHGPYKRPQDVLIVARMSPKLLRRILPLIHI